MEGSAHQELHRLQKGLVHLDSPHWLSMPHAAEVEVEV